jgi:UDP:flavonoid glycosyltransferase YjiC (YdhE family)
MTRVLIVTAGSRGDVAPFTGLGRRLRHGGYEVALAAHDRFAGLVRDSGLEHRTLPGDPVELTRARTAAPTAADAQAVFAAFLDELADGVLDAATGGTDILLTAFGPAPLSRAVAGMLDIPSLGVYLAPGVPTRQFAPPGWPGADHMTPAENLAAGESAATRSAALYASALRRLHHDPSDLSHDWPICHGFSPAVVPKPADWPEHVLVTGYWWPAGPPEWAPPPRLVDFLAAGPPPVFIGFGSMTPGHDHLQEHVEEAVKRAGTRAIIQSGWAGLTSSGDDVLLIDEVPHDWLFPRMAAVVHHAGAGTTAAGLRAGVPAIAVPVLVDQPFWAARLHHLGVSPPPLPMPDLTADTLAEALRTCRSEPSYRDRATALAARIRAEDGAAAVLAVTSRLTR